MFHGLRVNNIPHYKISYNTKYYVYPINNITKKGLNSIYNKFYFNLQDKKSKSLNVSKRQHARFEGLCKRVFKHSGIKEDRPVEDQLLAARQKSFLFQKGQILRKPLLHVRYKKKFVAPEDCYYTLQKPSIFLKYY
ncbi:hypothetical protein RhiirA4_490172 [Rhizophagus irregularis]|uniref:DUF8211 domain-containing protein n=1 Tax=Rhizophagus irregularis TaxID=588596 RepID=A0A2I1HVE9_9GLOM|nr:hypothetical protein RhiirA4_490172 [Rhizophagus irregularis]